MPITSAENIRVDGLNNREARKLIIKVAHDQGWSWFYDENDRLVVDVSDSLKLENRNDKGYISE